MLQEHYVGQLIDQWHTNRKMFHRESQTVGRISDNLVILEDR